jgi:hypothetical protein
MTWAIKLVQMVYEQLSRVTNNGKENHFCWNYFAGFEGLCFSHENYPLNRPNPANVSLTFSVHADDVVCFALLKGS